MKRKPRRSGAARDWPPVLTVICGSSWTPPPALGGSGGEGTNPEQLFAAGYAACFLSAIRAAAAEENADNRRRRQRHGDGRSRDPRGWTGPRAPRRARRRLAGHRSRDRRALGRGRPGQLPLHPCHARQCRCPDQDRLNLSDEGSGLDALGPRLRSKVPPQKLDQRPDAGRPRASRRRDDVNDRGSDRPVAQDFLQPAILQFLRRHKPRAARSGRAPQRVRAPPPCRC